MLRNRSTSFRTPLVLIAMLLAFAAPAAFANVTVTPASGGTNISADTVATSTYTTLGTITISEPGSSKGDIAVGSGVTLVLNAPTGWSFKTGAVTTNASGSGGTDISSISGSATATQLTITMTVGGTSKADTITISNVGIIPNSGSLASTPAGQILRSVASTETIAGITGATVFGNVSEAAGSAATFTVAPASASVTAGTPMNLTVTAKDQFSNTATGYTGTAHFTSSDAAATVPANYTFTAGDAGAHTFTNGLTLKTAGSQTVTATDTVTGTITGTSTNVTVSPSTPSSLVKNAGDSQNTGVTTAFATALTVTVKDAYNNLVPNASVTFTAPASGASSTFSSNSTNTETVTANGSAVATSSTFTANNVSGTYLVTVTSGSASTTFTETNNPDVQTGIALSIPATATAGSSFSATVRGVDQYGNTTPSYTGTVHFTSTDGQAVLPSDTTLVNGTATVSVTLKTSGSQSVTATDVTNNAYTATANTTVSAAAANHYTISTPATSTAGNSFGVTVTAYDQFNNVATNYAGTVHFTSNDGAAVLPANSGLTLGTGTFSVTLKTSGSRTVVATDTVTSSITATGNVAVSPASATSFTVGAPATSTAGNAISVTVTAKDAFNNVDTNYGGTVHFTSNDGQAVLPSDATLTLGTGTFSATLKTSGSKSVTATDTVTASITGTTSVTVSPAAATTLSVTAPASTTAGNAVSVTVTAKDAFNNTATSYAGTVHFTSTDGAAVLPANSTLTSGTGTFSVTLKTAGAQSVTGTDTVTASITGTANVTVNPAAAATFTVSAPASATAGVPFSVTVTAKDAFGNVATGYSGTVHYSSSDPIYSLPGDGGLGAGTATFSATLKTAGSRTVVATDTVTASITGTANVTVNPAAAATFTVSAPASSTAGAAFSITVTAKDAFNNTATGYAGTVHFTSSDAQAVLPANSTLTSGTGTFSTTLKTAGSQAVTATDTVTSSITGFATVTVNATTATKLAFTTQPGSATAGSAFGTMPVVKTQDTFGNDSTVGLNPNVTVTITLSTGTGPLQGTATGNIGTSAGNGVVSFSGLRIDNAADTKQLTAAANTFTSAVSNTFTVAPAAASQLVFTTQPSNTTAGATMSPSPVVKSEDPYGNVSIVGLGGSKTVTLGLASGTGSIAGTLSYDVVASAGTVTFNGLSMTVSGSKTFNATASGLTTATSNAFTINPAAADHLTIQTQTPATATAGAAFSPAPVVRIEDQYGNLRSTDTTTITAARGNTGSASLQGTTSVAAVAGVATFSSINYQKAETMNVAFSAAGLTGVTSNAVVVNPAAANKLTIATQPSATATAGVNFAQQPVVRIEDQYGNLRTADTTLITATRSAGTGTLQGTTAINAVGGIASYTDLHHNVSSTISIIFSASGLTSATSTNVVVSAAAADHFAVSAPGTATAGSAISVTVTAQDSFNNTATAYSGTVAITSNDGQAVVPGNSTLTNGVGTFSVTLKTAGTQTITATDTVSNSITGSANVNVSAANATKLVYVTQPGNATAGSVFGQQPVIHTEDPYGNFSTGGLANNLNLTIALQSGTGTLQGTATVGIGNNAGTPGIATFTNLRIDASGAKVLRATASGLTLADSNSFTVSPAATSTLVVSAPASTTAGNAFSVTVTAKDAFANVTPAYAGTVHFTSNDGQAVLPSDSTLTSGTGTFSVTLKTTGTKSVVATDTVSASITGSANVAVSAGAPATVTKTAGDNQTAAADSTRTASVNVTDAYGNNVPSTSVTFTVTAGSGFVNNLSTTSVNTDSSGNASVTWKFGPVAGTNTMTATAGAASATFNGTGTCTYTSKASGLWTNGPTWVGQCVPSIANGVTIASGHTVSVTSNSQAASLTFAAASADSNVNIASGVTLDVAGAVTFTTPGANQTTETLNVGAGTLNAGSVMLNGSGGQKETDLTVSTGTINISGDISFPGNPPTQKLTSTGAAHINIGGNFNAGGTLTLDPTSTLTFNGTGTQSVGAYNPNNYFPITVVNKPSGSVTTSGNLGIAGDFTITSGTFAAGNALLIVQKNFTNDATFTSTGTTQFSGSTAQTFGGSGTETFNSITMSNAAGLTISKNVTVPGTLTLTSGNITTGANTLSIASTGTVSRTSGHVIGNLQKAYTAAGSNTFEVGTANGYSPATVNATSGTYPATVTVKATQGAHPNAPSASSLQRYWTVTSNGISTADLTLNYLVTDVVGTESLYKFANYNAGWTYPLTGSVDSVNHIGSATGVTQFADFTLTETATNLAITSVNGGANPVAGTPFSVVVNSTSGDGSPAAVTTNTTVQLSLSNGTGILGGTLTGMIPAGQSTVTISGVTYTKAESGVVLAVNRTAGDPLTVGASAPFTVDPGATDHFAVSAPASTTAGSAISFTVIAQDALNNTTPAFAGTVTFTSSDAAATLPAPSLLSNGAGTFAVTFNTAGSQTITATSTTISGQATVTVNPGALHHFAVSAPASAIAGNAVSVTVTAQDSLNNTIPTYAGTVTFTSSDAAATLPAPSTLTNGTKSFSATFKTSGNQTITATDGAITGNATVAVSPAPTDHLVVTAPASVNAGTAMNVTVTAFDVFNNVTPNYAGTIHFTSTDTSATLPANYTFSGVDAGAHTFSITLITAGSRSITATDTVTSSVTGNASITVNAGSLDHFSVEQTSGGAIPAQIAGVPFAIRITARDAQNNIPNFTGTTTISSTGNLSSGSGTTAAFTSGVLASHSVTISNVGNFAITATDTGSSAAGTSNTFAVGGGIDLVTNVSGTANTLPGTNATYVVTVTNTGTTPAPGVVVNLTSPAGWTPSISGACSSFPCSLGSLANGATATINVTLAVPFGAGNAAPYSVTASASTSGIEVNTSNNTSTQLTTVPVVQCGAAVTTMLPYNGQVDVALTATLSWKADNADSYQVYFGKQGGGCSTLVATTSSTSYVVHLQAGQIYEWHVVALRAGCPPVASACIHFTAGTTCESVEPVIRALAEVTTGSHYHVSWTDLGASQYELQESTDDAFTSPTSIKTSKLTQMFTHDVTAPTPFYYRVRSVTATCAGLIPTFSPTVRVIVQPHGDPNSSTFDIVTENGSGDSVAQNAHFGGNGSGGGVDADNAAAATDYVATSDQPWLTVSPATGSIPPSGANVTLTANSSTLAAGTNVAMIRLATSGGAAIQTLKVALHVAEPVVEGGKDAPPSNASVIPGVAHAAGLNAQWQSDIRIYNPGAKPAKYALLFTPTAQDGTMKGRRVELTIASHATVALDDVVRHEFGYGVMNEAATGALEIRPLDASDKAIVTSRTYNLAPNGTYGQYIPAFAANQFAKMGDVMSLQQVAQSDAYRTNVGFVDASGLGARMNVRIYDDAGTQLSAFDAQLKPFEQTQMDSLLGSKGIKANDARIEVEVTSTDSKVMSYASVVDNKTSDPLLVTPAFPAKVAETRYVIPGVADFTTITNTWRSDVRIYNSSRASVTATATFFPGSGDTITKTITLAPGEVKAYDGVLQTLFGTTNNGGAMHVSTASQSSLVVTARTYDAHGNGTYGQFIPALTSSDGTSLGTRALEILGVEQSDLYRANIGVVEIGGKSADVAITATLPDGRTATQNLTLSPYQFVQYSSLVRGLGFDSATNVRVTIAVTAGQGRVAGYASVVDNRTQDPTYIPAQ